MSTRVNRLDLKDFRLIHSISQTGQLALSAQALSMTQPAASRMLAAIERKIGEQIFLRHPKGMTPTAVGEVLAQKSAVMLRNLEVVQREVLAISRGLTGTVRIGAVTSAVVAFVVPGVNILKETTEGSEVHVDVGPSTRLIDGLLKGDYDFVLSRLPPGTDTSLFSIRSARTEVLQFLVRSGHPLVTRQKLKLNDLEGFELAIEAPNTPLREAVDDAYIAHGVSRPLEIVNTASLLVTIAYLRSTNAIAPVSREVGMLFADTGQQWTALELEDPIVIKPYYLVARKGDLLNPLAQRLYEIVLDQINDAVVSPEFGQPL